MKNCYCILSFLICITLVSNFLNAWVMWTVLYWCIIERRINWSLPEIYRTLYEEVLNCFLKLYNSCVCIFDNLCLYDIFVSTYYFLYCRLQHIYNNIYWFHQASYSKRKLLNDDVYIRDIEVLAFSPSWITFRCILAIYQHLTIREKIIKWWESS